MFNSDIPILLISIFRKRLMFTESYKITVFNLTLALTLTLAVTNRIFKGG